ncbi:uncharacterized protein PHALS_07496 [Plasmopara halstedii]|uniref:Uncharacterized protein n=1 Tax=Plasmopara halstedii TaxID=4781 RepID=A0A0P1B4P0_PLAHL|nr:uncharacterized protein PHALS_07496 [Plasmopara halstedii]CEG49749.1 hypothetical protein PHALS_07496 [Plasmopara halstedii]|eukprot:XP_024586118.1 hypothetical protein PHALS_07496 [Plasmopara halstedii]
MLSSHDSSVSGKAVESGSVRRAIGDRRRLLRQPRACNMLLQEGERMTGGHHMVLWQFTACY